MAKKVSKEAQEKCRILTPEFRVSYPHIFKPQSIKPTDPPKYSVTMLFPKDSDLSIIKEAMRQAKIAAFGPKKSDWPDDLESPVNDGDDGQYADKQGYAGHWAIKASSNEDNKPGLVNKDVEEIMSQAEFYAGCYARAYVFARVWEYGKKQGIHFILDHVQKTRDGKSFGGKKPASQVFAPIEDDGDDDDDDDDADDTQAEAW